MFYVHVHRAKQAAELPAALGQYQVRQSPGLFALRTFSLIIMSFQGYLEREVQPEAAAIEFTPHGECRSSS